MATAMPAGRNDYTGTGVTHEDGFIDSWPTA